MVTAQSVTCQPCRPWRSVSLYGLLDGLEERAAASSRSSTSSRNSMPVPTGAGLDPQADGGQERVRRPRR